MEIRLTYYGDRRVLALEEAIKLQKLAYELIVQLPKALFRLPVVFEPIMMKDQVIGVEMWIELPNSSIGLVLSLDAWRNGIFFRDKQMGGRPKAKKIEGVRKDRLVAYFLRILKSTVIEEIKEADPFYRPILESLLRDEAVKAALPRPTVKETQASKDLSGGRSERQNKG